MRSYLDLHVKYSLLKQSKQHQLERGNRQPLRKRGKMGSNRKDRDPLSSQENVCYFDNEREITEQKHRTEVLNLLKSFEFERKDLEIRLRKEMEEREKEWKSKLGDDQYRDCLENHGEGLKEKMEKEKHGLQEQFDKEKKEFLAKIKELEEVKRHAEEDEKDSELSKRFDKKRKSTDEYFTDTSREATNLAPGARKGFNDESQREVYTSMRWRSASSTDEFVQKDLVPESSTYVKKSIAELEKENWKLEEELNEQHFQIHELKCRVEHLNGKLNDIRDLFSDESITFVDKEEKVRKIFEDYSGRSLSGSKESREKDPFEKDEINYPVLKQHRSSSEISFQMEELNLENEELKSRVHELEQKLRRNVEEYELQRSVFKDKVNMILKRSTECRASEHDDNSSERNEDTENTSNALESLVLEQTPEELLEDYVSIVLRQQSHSQSPDVFDVNLRDEIQSLEQLLDIEIFDGRSFDEEMKDEVKQVLHDKERELMVAYTVESLRDEIRHRVAVESLLEELRKQQEKDYVVNDAVKNILKEHLGITETVEDDARQLEKALMEYFLPEPGRGEEKLVTGSSVVDVEALKAEKKELERTLQELQDHFDKEKEAWLSNVEGTLQADTNDADNKDEIIQDVFAQKVIVKQALNTERFYLSRLYYMEMKEELETCLKQHRFGQAGRLAEERIIEAWKHHVEVSELYTALLDKENEKVEKIKGEIQERNNGKSDVLEISSEDKLGAELLKLEVELPVKLEMVKLQRKRCRDHKASSLILEQAVNAVETAVQEQDNMLVSGDIFERKSSWASSEEGGAGPEVLGTDYLVSKPEVVMNNEESKCIDMDSLTPDHINNKEALREALGKLLERLLNECHGMLDHQHDSNTSDSEFSEVESSTGKGATIEDEIALEKDSSDKDEDMSDTTSQESRPEVETESQNESSENDLETNVNPSEANVKKSMPNNEASESTCTFSETNDRTTEPSVPIIFKLPPSIENILNIERFNMSRLLRDEYVDKIRRERRKIRRIKVQNSENSEELVKKFQEHVGVLLEKVDFEESGKGKQDVSPKERKLTLTPSDDSGIADFSEQDKDEIVRRYKKLLEKARKDLNRVHRELRKRPRKDDGNEMDKELMKMKQNLKEKGNDLKELEEKQNGIESEHKVLLAKIKDITDPKNSSSAGGETMLLDSKKPKILNEELAFDEFPERSKKGKGLNHSTSSVERLDLNVENSQSGTHGCSSVREKEELKQKVDVLEKEIKKKDEEFSKENKKKQEEVNILQRKLVELKDENKVLEAKCAEMEKRHKLQKCSDRTQNDDVAKEVESPQNENVVLENENKLQQKKIGELQEKMFAGSDGEKILKDLQFEIKQLSKKKKILEKRNKELVEESSSKSKGGVNGDEVVRIVACLEQENETLASENQEMADEVVQLQKASLQGKDGEEILENLQSKLKDLNITNKALEKKCRDLEETVDIRLDSTGSDVKQMDQKLEKVNDEKQKLVLDIKCKEDEIVELQKRLLQGCGGEELLENLQQQIKKLKEQNQNLELCCHELEDINEELKGKDGNKRTLEAEMAMIQKENDKLVDESNLKDREIRELQKTLVQGSGEDVLQRLQDTVKQLEIRNSELERQCVDLKDANEQLNLDRFKRKKEKDECSILRNENIGLVEKIEEKDSEIRELQRTLVEGGGGAAILEKLQDKIEGVENRKKELEHQCKVLERDNDKMGKKEEDLRSENKKMAKEVALLRKENDYLECESQTKNNEISKLQEKLLKGTGGEDILQELQGQVKELEEKNKEMRKKCNEMEARKVSFKGDMDTEEDAELNKLKDENKRLHGDNSSHQKEIFDLQKKLLERTNGNDILETIQGQLMEVRARNEKLQVECSDLRYESEKLERVKANEEEDMEKVSRLRKENASLIEVNEQKDSEINELQRKLVDGSGGEKILEDLQDKVKALEQKREELEKRCGELENENKKMREKDDLGGDNKEMPKDLSGLKKENDYLECGSQKTNDEMSKFQQKLLNGTGGEEILYELQGKLKEPEEINKKTKKKCNQMETREKSFKEDEADMDTEKDRELNILKDENERLREDNKSQEKEISDLQNKLLEGTAGKEIVESIQRQLKELKKSNKALEAECFDLKYGNEKVEDYKTEAEEKGKKILRLSEENATLVEDNEKKDGEIQELQRKLVDGCGGEEVLENLQNKVGDLERKNKKLQKKCKDFEIWDEKIADKEEDLGNKNKRLVNEVASLRKENDNLERKNKRKSDEISKLQEMILGGSGEEEILQELQGQVKELEEKNTELRKKCNEIEAQQDASGEDENDVDRQKDKDLNKAKDENKTLRENNKSKDFEICDIQTKLLEGCDDKDTLETIQEQLEKLKKRNENLETKCFDLKDENDKLRLCKNKEKEDVEKISRLGEENASLSEKNEQKDSEIRKRQKKLIDRSGAEEILQDIQDKVMELEKTKKEAEEQCRILKNHSKEMRKEEENLGRKNNKLVKEVATLRKENDHLERESQAKCHEILKLQEKLLNGTGGEEILNGLQCQVKELEELNKEMRKKCDEVEAREESAREAKDENNELLGKELLDVRDELKRMSLMNKEKEDEIAELQKKLVKGTAAEDIVEDLYTEVEELREKNSSLEIDSRDLERVRRRLKDLEREKELEVDELKEANNGLVFENETKEKEIRDLQAKFVSGTGGEEVLKQFENDVKIVKTKNNELEDKCKHLKRAIQIGKQDERLRDELTELKNDYDRLKMENKEQSEEISKLQQNIAEGTGSEEIVSELRNRVNQLNEKNEKLEIKIKEDEKATERDNTGKKIETLKSDSEILSQDNHGNNYLGKEQNKLENVEEMARKEERPQNELDKLKKTVDRMKKENEGQKGEIVKLQRKLMIGTGDEELFEELQEHLKDSKEHNNELEARCQDFEQMIGWLKNDDSEKTNGFRESGNDLEKERELGKLRKAVGFLEKENKNKEDEIIGLQKKLLEGTGGEEVLLQLQDHLRDSKKKTKALEIRCSNLEKAKRELKNKNEKLLKGKNQGKKALNLSRATRSSLKRVGRMNELKDVETANQSGHDVMTEKEVRLSGDQDGINGEFTVEDTYSKNDAKLTSPEENDKTYEECIEMIPKITEEKGYWKAKYKALREKVGSQFVDIIPEVWREETELEKQRNETLLRISELKEEIAAKESPVLKILCENERIEKKLKQVGDQLKDDMEQLRHLKDLENQEEIIKEEKAQLIMCLEKLDGNYGDDNLGGSVVGGEDNSYDLSSYKITEDNNENKYDESGRDMNKMKVRISEFCQELQNLHVAHEKLKMKRENGVSALFNDKVEIQEEIKGLEQAIQELQQKASVDPGVLSNQSSDSKRLAIQVKQQPSSQKDAMEIELEKVLREVNEIQSSLGMSGGSSEKDVDNLVTLMKEKSKLEDELTAAERTLNQLGRRDYDNLLKERAKQEKVAKKLLDLAREKEVIQTEFQEIETLVKGKEAELLSYYSSEKNEGSQGSLTEKDKSFRKMGSLQESGDSGKLAPERESDKDDDGEVKSLSSEELIVVTEELGSMILNKSSLAARLESLGKEITAQSLKVEKSLLGVKEDPSGELTPTSAKSPIGETALESSFTSIDDLTQSQLSVFDNYDMIDELSLATVLVREERLKRKSLRKAPMAKLLKEKASLEKKLKDIEGKVLVQNTKIKNSLREGKDGGKAKEKFIRAVEERKKIEDELSNVAAKIDECKLQGDEFSKGKLGKRRASSGSLGKKGKTSPEKKGTSLSKNDKRRLLSQRESLQKRLDGVKWKVENFSLNGDDNALEDFPEMAEVGNFGKMVERLRELVTKEAELKHKLKTFDWKEELPQEKDLKDMAEECVSNDHGETTRMGEGSVMGTFSYDGVVNVLLNAKQKKEAKLESLEKDIKQAKNMNSEQKEKQALRKKKKILKDQIENALEDLKEEKQTIDSLRESSINVGGTIRENEKLLKDDITTLKKQKEELEEELAEANNSFEKQIARDQNMEEIFREYQDFVKLNNEKKQLEQALKDLNKKLFTRKQWVAAGEEEPVSTEEQGETTSGDLTQVYGDILKRISEESVNMADLIRELEVTQETLSKEREITAELLELIKSRVGNELLEALTGEGLASPLAETSEIHLASAEKYPEFVDKAGHSSVTVSQVIEDYKKINELSQKENERLHNKLQLLKRKVDEDLFASIVNQKPTGLEISKKFEISRILENNETLFQQIVTRAKVEGENETQAQQITFLENENEKLRMEMESKHELHETNKRMKEELDRLKEGVENITVTFNDEKERKNELQNSIETLKNFKDKYDSSKEMLEHFEKENTSIRAKLDESLNEHDEMKNNLNYVKQEKNELQKVMQRRIDDIGSKYDKLETTKKDIENELEKIKRVFEEKLAAVENEKNAVALKYEQLEEMNNQRRKELDNEEDTKKENKKLKEQLASLKDERNDVMAKELENVRNGTTKKITEKSTHFEELKEENDSLKQMMDVLEKENNEMIPAFEKLKMTNKELEDEVEYLRQEEKDYELLRENLRNAENEVKNLEEMKNLKAEKDELDNYISLVLQRSTANGLKTALEDYNKEFQEIKANQDLLAKECENLKNRIKDIEAKYHSSENQSSKAEQNLRQLQKIVGQTLSDRLLTLPKEKQVVLRDTDYEPRCLESIFNKKNSLARVLEDYENDFDLAKKRLGQELFCHVLNKTQPSQTEIDTRELKVVNELKDGKDLTGIVRAYEDIIDSQANEMESLKILSQKVEAMETELKDLREKNFTGSEFESFSRKAVVELGVMQRKDARQDGTRKPVRGGANFSKLPKMAKEKASEIDNDSLAEEKEGDEPSSEAIALEPLDMEKEYQDLLMKVIEHQQEIEDAEGLLHVQRQKHEVEKQELLRRMKHQMECERISMETEMQNLINEIVRLKEERKEIRKNNRLDREKLVEAFDKERVEFYSTNEVAKAEIQEKLQNEFLEVLQKEKMMMRAREEDLKREVFNLENEKKETAVKLNEMKNKLESNEMLRESDQSFIPKEKGEMRHQIRDEFEEKMKHEKKKFQETLISLRHEVERLQKERRKMFNEISRNKAHFLSDESANFSALERHVYSRIETEFKAKINSEKMATESRIKELKEERESLNKQKQEMKTKMRTQRLEMNKIHEKEKEELIEKHREEIKVLKNKLQEKTQDNMEAKNVARPLPDSRTFYELQRANREKDAKIKRYERFFKELNQEASVFQKVPDISV